ncbi:MAG: carboxypeptidase-like regulatory domain-containing protein [Chitinophagaceae bacterium]
MMRVLLAFLFSFTYLFVSAQAARELNGIVYASNSKEVLAGASILIFNAGHVTGLVANKEGRFIIPVGTLIDSLHVSMVGYFSKTLTNATLNNTSTIDIPLDVAAAELQEVVVKPFTALDVVKKACAGLSMNQPQGDFENKGFYREIIKDRENYFSVAEAVFTAQYFPSSKDYKLKLEQGRSKEDVAYTRLFEDFHPGGGPQAVAGNSFITGKPAFLNLKELNKFHYRIDSIVQFDGRRLYHISFDQNSGVKEALDKGYMLVETENFAVVRYEVENSPIGIPYIKSLSGSDKVFAEILNIDFKRRGWKRRVDFTEVNQKWLMTYARTEYAITYKQPKKDLDLDLTINIELAFTDLYKMIDKKIEKGEEWKKKNIVANLPTAFDPAFWGSNAIISPTEEVKNIIAGISRNNNDLPVAESIEGWQYINRNLFFSYKKDDTITMIPLMKCIWEDEENGPMLYRETDSDFIVESKIVIVKNSDKAAMPDKGFQQAGIIIRSSGNPKENYVLLSLGTGGNPNPKLFFKRTIDNRSKTVLEKRDNMNGLLRLEKSGKKITAFFEGENENSFRKIGEYNLDWLNGKVQIGLAAFAAFSGDGPKMKPDMRASFSQFKTEMR